MYTATMEAPAAAKSTLVGGWTNFNFTLTPQAKEVFQVALKGFVGVGYTPLAFATQVVAGTNWCFLSKAVMPGSDYENAVLLYIYQPLEGTPHITEINKIKPGF